MKKERKIIPKQLEDFDEEKIPFSCKVIIYYYLKNKTEKEKLSINL